MLVEDGHLSLAFQEMEEVPEDVARDLGPRVVSLNLEGCGITSFRNLEHLSRLKTLVLDKNCIGSLSGCGPIPTLEVLWMNNCQIRDLEALLNDVDTFFPHLKEISLMRNPGLNGLMDIQHPDEESLLVCRIYIIWRLPHLQVVDGDPIQEFERKNAALRGQYALKRKPLCPYKPPEARGKSSKWKNKLSSMANAILGSPSSVSEYDPGGVKCSSPQYSCAEHRLRLSFRTRRYEGYHSEGNRFISNDNL